MANRVFLDFRKMFTLLIIFWGTFSIENSFADSSGVKPMLERCEAGLCLAVTPGGAVVGGLGSNATQPVTRSATLPKGLGVAPTHDLYEVDLLVLPQVGELLFRKYWEGVTRVATESHQPLVESETLNEITGAYGFSCGGLKPTSTSIESNMKDKECKRIKKSDGSQPVLIQYDAPKGWLGKGGDKTSSASSRRRLVQRRRLLGKAKAKPTGKERGSGEMIQVGTAALASTTAFDPNQYDLSQRVRGAVVLVRNPVDAYEETFRDLNADFIKTKNPADLKWHMQFEEYFNNVYMHFMNDVPNHPRRTVIRYEDLHANPKLALKTALIATGVAERMNLTSKIINDHVKKVSSGVRKIEPDNIIGAGFHFVQKLPEAYRKSILDVLEWNRAALTELGYMYYLEGKRAEAKIEEALQHQQQREDSRVMELMALLGPADKHDSVKKEEETGAEARLTTNVGRFILRNKSTTLLLILGFIVNFALISAFYNKVTDSDLTEIITEWLELCQVNISLGLQSLISKVSGKPPVPGSPLGPSTPLQSPVKKPKRPAADGSLPEIALDLGSEKESSAFSTTLPPELQGNFQGYLELGLGFMVTVFFKIIKGVVSGLGFVSHVIGKVMDRVIALYHLLRAHGRASGGKGKPAVKPNYDVMLHRVQMMKGGRPIVRPSAF